jgi:hypothetical protein
MDARDSDSEGLHFFDWERGPGAPSKGQTPEYAHLPGNLTVDGLGAAIAQSGYPFQATVIDILENSLNKHDRYPMLQEEWAYLDSETGQIRSIDIFAEMPLTTQLTSPGSSVVPYLNVLVECKQSEMPYIFFVRGRSPSEFYEFPEIAGLPSLDPDPISGRRGSCGGIPIHDEPSRRSRCLEPSLL